MTIINLVIVEDDPMVMAVNKDFINQIGGFSIVGSERTGRKGIETIKSIQPRLVILDIYLPDMSGVDLLKEMRRQEVPADVIMITAAQDVDTVQDCLRFGVVDYIIKPFKYERIKVALEKYKAYVSKVKGRGNLVQEELDSLINMSLQGGEETRLGIPKGLREITLKQVLNCLAESERGLSAEEVAIGVGLARVTARRYLEYLERIGQAQLESQYGSIGRPINRFKIIQR
ncbi:MAG: response regulator [Desulfitobacterium hafniense]|nr:response regulator [Desulfitobacterium hafniense]